MLTPALPLTPGDQEQTDAAGSAASQTCGDTINSYAHSGRSCSDKETHLERQAAHAHITGAVYTNTGFSETAHSDRKANNVSDLFLAPVSLNVELLRL